MGFTPFAGLPFTDAALADDALAGFFTGFFAGAALRTGFAGALAFRAGLAFLLLSFLAMTWDLRGSAW
ncbi:MAG: hypothetical protein ACHQZQ_04390 [SAR324 cluster bacterium]